MDKSVIEVSATVSHLKYTTHLSKGLKSVITDISKLDECLAQNPSFNLGIDDEQRFAVSRWVSPKRTRSYPFAHVYDTLPSPLKKVTIIPIIKDEGKRGERDYIQWDTISLMSLLGVYVIIAYYVTAVPSTKATGKITDQRFDSEYVEQELLRLNDYMSSPVHWNYEQIEKISQTADRAVSAYESIEEDTGIPLHSLSSAIRTVEEKFRDVVSFKKLSRKYAQRAQSSESKTIQPLENISGQKGKLDIENHLGGHYNITADEVRFGVDGVVHLVEAKHTKDKMVPSVSDIKDALIKMALFTNCHIVSIEGSEFEQVPVLKLTSRLIFEESLLNTNQREFWENLKKEAIVNGFILQIGELP